MSMGKLDCSPVLIVLVVWGLIVVVCMDVMSIPAAPSVACSGSVALGWSFRNWTVCWCHFVTSGTSGWYAESASVSSVVSGDVDSGVCSVSSNEIGMDGSPCSMGMVNSCLLSTGMMNVGNVSTALLFSAM